MILIGFTSIFVHHALLRSLGIAIISLQGLTWGSLLNLSIKVKKDKEKLMCS